jgi:hypothetical protein
VYIPSAAVTTTVGSIYLAAEYDPSDAVPSTLAAMSTYEHQNNSRVYTKCTLGLRKARMFDGVQHKKIRCGPVAGDLSLYDGGRVIVGTVDGPGSAVGQLWAYYDIELFSPQTDPTSPIPSKLTVLNLSSAQTFTTTTAAPIEFDEAIVDGLGLGLPSTGVLTLPCGTFKVFGEICTTDSAAGALSVSLELKKNSASTVPPQIIYCDLASTVSSGDNDLGYNFYVFSDGDDTIELECTMIGSNTLTLREDATRVFIEVV